MRYGMIGGFIKFAFAKTAFDYIEKEIPEIEMATFEMQGAVLDRTKTLGYGDDECNFHLMSKQRAEEIGFVPSPDAK